MGSERMRAATDADDRITGLADGLKRYGTQRQQLRVLFRLFLFKVVDAELISNGSDPEKLLGQIVTALLSVSFLVSVPLMFMSRRLPEETAGMFQHFFIATTMLVVGLFAVLSWDEVFPSRRDVLVLSPLQVPPKTIFLAKMAALGAGLGISVGALNGVSGLLWPWMFGRVGGGIFGPFRAMASFWVTLVMAGIFFFAATLMLQGVTALVFPRRMFLRVSALIQIVLFCVLVSVYVLEPSLESKRALSAIANERLLEWLPSYWFWGMFHELNGSAQRMPELMWLAKRAWNGVGIAIAGAVTTVMLHYFRAMQRIVEEPEIVPGRRGISPAWGSSAQRAVFSFVLATISRSRKHRLMLSFYVGAGLGVMLILLRPSMGSRSRTAVALLAASVLMLCTAAVAMRMVFSMPMMLEANWVFGVASREPAQSYLEAVRRSFLLLAIAPVWSAFAVVLFRALPSRAAAAHLAALAMLGVMLADVCMGGFGKIPFTCSYQPGKGNLQFAVWGVVVLLPLVVLAASFEWMHLQRTRGQLIFALALVLPAAWLRWWTRKRLQSVGGLLFEDVEEPPIVSLELTVDAALQA
jgi:hypothetical protein